MKRNLALAALSLLLTITSTARADDTLSAHDIARLRGVGEAAISPDGRSIAYTLEVPRDPFDEEDGTAWSELHVVGADGASRPYIVGQVRIGTLGWTPDGGAVSFLAKRGDDEHDALWTIPVDGGEARRVAAHETDVSGYSFDPAGKRVAYLAKDAVAEDRKELEEKGFDQEVFEEEDRPVKLWILDLGGGDDAEAEALDLPGSASELHWSPSGESLAVALAPTSLVDDHYMKRRLHVVSVASGEVTARVEHAAKMGEAAWSPDGRLLAWIAGEDLHDPREGRLMVVPAAGGEPRDLLPGYAAHVSDFAWVDAETVAYLGDEGVWTTLNTVAADGGLPRVLLDSGGPIWRSLSLGSDGRTAALRGDTPSHPAELFRFDLAAESEPRRLTDSNPWLADRNLAERVVVSWEARDGLALEGLLVRPSIEGDQRVPLVLMVHGGPEAHYRNGWLTSYSRPAQTLAASGIASFYPNYRGSTGRGVEFSKLSQGDPGGKEFDDLVDAVDHLVGIGLVDRDRVGVTGGSYGGFATAWCSTYFSERFAAGVMFVGISNEISKWGTSDIPNELNLVHLRHWPWDDFQLALERSPIYYAEKARTPLLILHGKKDTRVFPGQSMELYRTLKTLGQTPVRLVLYPNEGHGNRRAAARLDYSLRLIRWMQHYLQGEGGEPPAHGLEYEDPRQPEAEE